MPNLPSLINKSIKPRKRIILTIFFFLGMFFILLIRLWFLQVVKGEEYRILSEGNRIRLKRLKALRGLILDRNYEILVQNRPSFILSIVPEDIKNIHMVLNKLSVLLNKPEDKMKEAINKARTLPFEPITLLSDLSFSEVALLEEHRNDLPGIAVEVETKRFYPHKKLAAHLLGYMGEINTKQLKMEEFHDIHLGDQIGQSGIEKVANSYLFGRDGGKHVEVDAEGRELRTLGYLAPEPGKNIILTIDIDLQKKAEEVLGERCGAIIAMNPQNGEILAMVSHPAFNPNLFARGISKGEWLELLKNPKNPLQNRTIMASYPPGSIFKIVLSFAGLDLGVIDKRSNLYCGGSINIGNWTYYCWKKEGHGNIFLHEAIVHSCNVYFYQLGAKLGIDKIAKYAQFFGLGTPTGLILNGENKGLIPTSPWKMAAIGTPWYPGETIAASIGQGYVLVTPIQLACMISALANEGLLYQPNIISAIKTPDGEIIKRFTSNLVGKVPIKAEYLHIIRQALKAVVNEKGTGWRAYSKTIEIAGKTGTAQVAKIREQDSDQENGAEENLPEELRDHAWFVAFAPYNMPEIAVVVLVEHGGHGGYTSAVFAKQIIEEYLK